VPLTGNRHKETNPQALSGKNIYGTAISKGKAAPVLLSEHHAMEAYWVSGQLHDPAALPPGKEPLVPI